MISNCHEYAEEVKKLDRLLNKWRLKSPLYWSKIDIFCWLYDWSLRNNVEFTDLEKFYIRIPKGKELCDMNFEFFTNLTFEYGMDLFEDLQIMLSSFIKKIRRKKNGEKIFRTRKIRKKNNSNICSFLKEILFSSQTNPRIIKWINLSEKIFQLVQPDCIAEIWGKITLNEKMNSEKFSRALRYCYKKKFIKHCEQNLTYKFGKNVSLI